jgi:hypothetical protein
MKSFIKRMPTTSPPTTDFEYKPTILPVAGTDDATGVVEHYGSQLGATNGIPGWLVVGRVRHFRT